METKTLTIEHLAPYLPYGLKMKLLNFPIGDGIRTLELDCGHDFYFYLSNNYVRPILRPLSDWRMIENGTLFFSPFFHSMQDMDGGIEHNIMSSPYYDLRLLFVNHFDVFGLLDAGLAINSNSIDHE